MSSVCHQSLLDHQYLCFGTATFPITKVALIFSQVIHLDTRRMTNVLGIQPRDPKTTVVDMAYSMIENGMIKKAKGYNGPPPT